MLKVLCVAEKNDAAKNIAEILSRGNMQRREGLSKYNKIYQFNYAMLGSANAQVSMTSVSGHLLNYEFDSGHRNWSSCHPIDLFTAPVIKECNKDMAPLKRTLEREAARNSVLVIWTDCDREGENIGFEVIEVCKAANPRLRVYRARFSEITFASISRAVRDLQPPNLNVSAAVDCRSELDLRIGAAFTRLQTLRFQKRFPQQLNQKLISYGSCQFPTLGFVVERFLERKKFIAEPFWKLKVIHTKDNLRVEFQWKRFRLFDQLACQVLLDVCKDAVWATVERVDTKPKTRRRPVALDTVELEKNASRKLRIGAKEMMTVAEKLYTKGFISYPRTETNAFPKSMDLVQLVQEQTGDPNWGQFAHGILQNGPNPRNGNKSDQAHPPIHPTKYTNQLQGTEKSVYDFVVRHFLACLSKDAEGMETTVEIDLGQEGFTTSGLMIIAPNYLEVYPYDRWSDKNVPIYQVGERFKPDLIDLVEGTTTGPNLLSEADLIALMERHGIGTDATHAEHIETIKARMYVGLQPDQRFIPGFLGLGLVEGYDSMGFEMSKPRLRAELEKDLQKICDGIRPKDVVLREQVAKYRDFFEKTIDNITHLDRALGNYFGDGNPPNPPTGGHGGGGGAGPPPPGPPRPPQRPFGGDNNDDGNDDDDNRPDHHPQVNQPHNTDASPPSDDHNGTSTQVQECDCHTPAAVLTVKKEGPNFGRSFYSCPNRQCQFFLWVPLDAAESTQEVANLVPHTTANVNFDDAVVELPVEPDENELLGNQTRGDKVIRCFTCPGLIRLSSVETAAGETIYALRCSRYPRTCKKFFRLPNGLEIRVLEDEPCDECVPERLSHKLFVQFRQQELRELVPTGEHTGCIECDADLKGWLQVADLSAPIQPVKRMVKRPTDPKSTAKKRKVDESKLEEEVPEDPLGGARPIESPYFAGRNRPGMWGVGVVNVGPSTSAASTSRQPDFNASSQVQQCGCRMPAVILTVKKEGPNLGRPFYTCPNRQCQFFLWAPLDSAGSTQPTGYQPQQSQRGGKSGRGRNGNNFGAKKKWKVPGGGASRDGKRGGGGSRGNRRGRGGGGGRGPNQPSGGGNSLNTSMFPKAERL